MSYARMPQWHHMQQIYHHSSCWPGCLQGLSYKLVKSPSTTNLMLFSQTCSTIYSMIYSTSCNILCLMSTHLHTFMSSKTLPGQSEQTIYFIIWRNKYKQNIIKTLTIDPKTDAQFPSCCTVTESLLENTLASPDTCLRLWPTSFRIGNISATPPPLSLLQLE